MKNIFARCALVCAALLAVCSFAGCTPTEEPEKEPPKNEKDVSFHPLSAGGEGNVGGGADYTLEVNKPAEARNYLSAQIESTVALKGEIAYIAGGKPCIEEFYTLSGKTDFRQILNYYGENGDIGTISSLSFSSLTGETGTVKVGEVAIANHPIDFSGIFFGAPDVEPQLQLYLKGEKITLGCTLKSGGAINWLSSEDAVASRMTAKDGEERDTYYVGKRSDAEGKENFLSVVTEGHDVNLVNTADNGRLVQQSYYGALDDENYESEQYNGSTWPYNPVQGGSMSNAFSLLTDVRITEKEIYVKTRPLDWAKKKSVTPSYMENRYTLEKSDSGMEYVRVENRFTDFSGYKHGSPRHQELPAFYCISPLGRAVYYTGDAPFTGAPLSQSPDLGFWGTSPQPPESHLSCDENWIVWANEDEWGVGLYVPDVTSVLAGRYEHNVDFWTLFAKGAYKAAATCYCAPLATFALQSYTAFEYEYCMAVGSVEENRALFCSLKEGGAANPSVAGKQAW